MQIVFYIVMALSFGIADMLLLRRSVSTAPIPLSRGLVASALIAFIQAALFLIGMWIGDLLRFELPDNPEAFAKTNAFVFIGLDLCVMLRMLLPYLRKKATLPTFNLTSNPSLAALSLASGINLLLIGLGTGFVHSPITDFHRAFWPLLIVLTLASYWGIMLGRRDIALRPKRWMLLAAFLLLGLAVASLLSLN